MTELKWLIMFLCSLLFAIVLFLSLAMNELESERDSATGKLENTEKVLQEQMTKLSSMEEELYDYKSVGGVETDVPSLPSEDIVFPIAEEDFLRYTSPYGQRTSPFLKIKMHHSGIDMATVWKAQVVSVADGTVISHYPAPGTPYPGGGVYRGHNVYGGMVQIDHGNFTTLYAHLSSTDIRQGQKVKAGQLIGRVGSSGISKGMHLHFEMEVEGKLVNPLLFLSELDYWRK